jgi:antirestriction protein ArdC
MIRTQAAIPLLGLARRSDSCTQVTGQRPVTDEATGETTDKRWAILRYFRVFNASQADWADGMPERFRPDHPMPDGFDPVTEAEAIADGYFDAAGSPRLVHGGDVAFYSPLEDKVQVPHRESFRGGAEFYSTLFHEMTHSTGHKSRLNREGVVEGHAFGDELYAAEELIAEMGAAMLCGLAGVEQVTLGNSAAYIANWRKVLAADPRCVVNAAAKAQRACDLITGATFEAAVAA